MELIKITDLVSQLDISSRSLRYYEQVGLIQSIRPDLEKYRYYDSINIERLKQIIVLRKMQIPIKDIIRIYECEDISIVVETFVDRINAIDGEINALIELKSITNEFLHVMIKKGIKKISALPLLYEEMDKQLEVLEERKPANYNDLASVSDKLIKPLDIRINLVPKMRVLTSYLKHNNTSDTDGFWKWINDNNIDYGTPGSHTLMEQQYRDVKRDKASDDSPTMLVKIPYDFKNTSPFKDRIFVGGLYAVASTYVDEDINVAFRSIINEFDNNKYYEIDYLHNGELRDEPLIETVISPDELRDKIDIFIPVKKRLADISNYNNEKHMNLNITLEEIEKANPIARTIPIDLKAMVPIGMKAVNGTDILNYKFYDFNDTSEIELHSYLLARQLVSSEMIKIPFILELDCIIPKHEMEIRVCHDVGHIEISFPDDNIQITIREPVFGIEHKHIFSNNIHMGQDTNIKWIVGEKHFAIIINGEVKYCVTNLAYMQLERNTYNDFPIRIAAAYQHESLTIRSIRILPIVPTKISNLKKGELIMITKQSNNVLPNIHPLVTYHYGENYNFNSCMKMLIEYADPNEMYTYSFFAGLTGDNFVQVYGKKEQYENNNGCLTCVWDGSELMKYVFGQIGYEYAYITAGQIAANKSMYIDTVKAFIDKGLPVIFIQNRSYNPIVGYEENGKYLLFMEGERVEPLKMNTDGEIQQDWIFIGAKNKETDFKQILINALSNIANLLTSPDKYGCSYGSNAFRNWADDIENGRFDEMTEEQFDGWKYHSVYICNLATNFCGVSFDFLDKVKKIIPELACIYDEYKKMNDRNGLEKLQELEGNFNVTLTALQDRERRTAIANEIRNLAPLYENFSNLIKDRLAKIK